MRVFLICAALLMGVLGPGQAQGLSHLEQYPGLSQRLHWGMVVSEIEEALETTVSAAAKNKYEAKMMLDEVEADATFLVAEDGLEAVILRFDVPAADFEALLAHLKDVYGPPTGFDLERNATQWKDRGNDTGVMVIGERDGLYSVLVGLRRLQEHVASDGLEPGKVSSLEGVTLGMSEASFKRRRTYFEASLVPPSESAPPGTVLYQAALTIDLTPSEAFFEFSQGRLVYIMVYLETDSTNEASLQKAFDSHLGFLAQMYGEPVREGELMVFWKTPQVELRYGLHPAGKLVVSWMLQE